MKKLILIISLLLVATININAQETEFPKLTGPYLGQKPPSLKPEKFEPKILSAEKHPHGQLAFSPDGKEVFWSAMLREGPEQTIYYIMYNGEKYTNPQRAPFAADSGNGGPAFSYDGNRLFFNAQFAAQGASSRPPTAICYVQRNSKGWSQPVIIESTFDTLMTKGQVSVARNGNIYFSGRVYKERAPGIYFCRYVNEKYLPPEKLIGNLASMLLLVDPWIDPDEKFLLVSCPPIEGPPMLTDIGICTRLPDGGWSLPVRLGGRVNTPAFERFPSLSRDGKYLFFIRSLSQQFVDNQAHFYWVSTKIIEELRQKNIKE